MPSTETQMPAIPRTGVSLIIAIMPAAAILITLLAAYAGAADTVQVPLLATSFCIMFGLLLRLYRVISRSHENRALAPVRLHLLLHLVPLIFLLIYRAGATSPWITAVLVLLFLLFFASGRKAWRLLSSMFPSTPLYRIFYRGNTAFLIWFPLLYLATLLAPDFISFSTIKRVALFYFSIHFMMVGLASLRIESDLRTRTTATNIGL